MSLLVRLCLLVLLAGLPAVAIQVWDEFALKRAREAEVFEEARRIAGQITADLGRIVEGARRLLDLSPVRADASQLEMALLNPAVNAPTPCRPAAG